MSSYILVGRNYDDKCWWNDLVRACAVIGDTFEIHCGSDEKAETMAALKYGYKATSSWSGGTVTNRLGELEYPAAFQSAAGLHIGLYRRLVMVIDFHLSAVLFCGIL